MANLSEDIQCASSDTRPPMLDRSDFKSWQQRVLHLGPEQDRVFADLTPEEKDRFKADIRGQDNSFDADVDEPPTMFMANLSSADPIYDEAGPSYDSNILSEVQDHDDYIDNAAEYHEFFNFNTSSLQEGRTISEYLWVGYEHVAMNIVSHLEPVFGWSNLRIREERPVIRTSQSRQHDKSEPASYYLKD
ncbi:hypothetical protein Tco_1322159 [Tanacetum coccineum]